MDFGLRDKRVLVTGGSGGIGAACARLELASPTLSGHTTGEVVTVSGGMEGRVLHER